MVCTWAEISTNEKLQPNTDGAAEDTSFVKSFVFKSDGKAMGQSGFRAKAATPDCLQQSM